MFVITGGSHGIGQALAEALALQNQQVLIIGRNEAALQRIAHASPHIQMLCADITSAPDRKKIYLQLDDKQTLQGLIHNAGIVEPIAPLHTLSEAGWHAILETNLTAPFLLTQKLNKKLHGGRLLQISSHFLTQPPIGGLAPYCVSKAGVTMLTRCWQLDCPEIASAYVLPGLVDTQMQHVVRESMHVPTEQRQFLRDLKANHQLIPPATVASFLSWLLLQVETKRYTAQAWDIYDTSHHHEWLTPPHQVIQVF